MYFYYHLLGGLVQSLFVMQVLGFVGPFVRAVIDYDDIVDNNCPID